jgi:hypothetical protein
MTAASQSPVPNVNLWSLVLNNNGAGANWSSDQIAAIWVGAGLNATHAANLESRINTYMTAWGINVYQFRT